MAGTVAPSTATTARRTRSAATTWTTASAIVPIDLHPRGRLNMRNAVHAVDDGPIMPGCDCPACAGGYSRRYIRHLFQQEEVLGLRLLTLHNLRVMLDLVWRARAAIAADQWANGWYEAERARWAPMASNG